MSIGSEELRTTLFSNKEKSLLGCRGQKGLMEWFNNVAEGADPNAANWAVVEDNDGTVTVEMSAEAIGFCRLHAGSAATNDSTINTNGLKTWNIDKSDGDILSLNWESKVNIVNAEGEYAFGFGKAAVCVASSYDAGTNWSAGIHCDNDVVRFCTDDGTTLEATAITASITENTEQKYLVSLSTTDVKLYVDGTLLATHETRVPGGVMSFLGASKNTNGVQSDLKLQYVNVWTE